MTRTLDEGDGVVASAAQFGDEGALPAKALNRLDAPLGPAGWLCDILCIVLSFVSPMLATSGRPAGPLDGEVVTGAGLPADFLSAGRFDVGALTQLEADVRGVRHPLVTSVGSGGLARSAVMATR
jgi:hypothetical protein